MRELWLNELLASRGGQGVKVLCPVSVDQGSFGPCKVVCRHDVPGMMPSGETLAAVWGRK